MFDSNKIKETKEKLNDKMIQNKEVIHNVVNKAADVINTTKSKSKEVVEKTGEVRDKTKDAIFGDKLRLEESQGKLQAAIKKTNNEIEKLGIHVSNLFNTLNNIQEHFDKIRNVPSEQKLVYEEVKELKSNWKQHVEKIDDEYKDKVANNIKSGAAGIGLGASVALFAPTVAMGVATTFGVASTGTAIATLSGAAANSAALAWLGGGALAAGGGGMAAGNFILALAGPIGWGLAGAALITSGVFFVINSENKKHLERIFTRICDRDEKSYSLAIVEINERISRIVDETNKLNIAIGKIQTFGLDYCSMREDQQYELGSFVNLMKSSTQLLVNPIFGLQPKYIEDNYNEFLSNTDNQEIIDILKNNKEVIIALTNILYNIEIADKDIDILYKSFVNDENFLSSLGSNKNDFTFDIMKTAIDALGYKKK